MHLSGLGKSCWGSHLGLDNEGTMPEDLLPRSGPGNRAGTETHERSPWSEGFSPKTGTGMRVFEGGAWAKMDEGTALKASKHEVVKGRSRSKTNPHSGGGGQRTLAKGLMSG